MLRESRHCPEYSEIFPTRRLDPGHVIGGRTQRNTGRARPRWFGQALSDMPNVGNRMGSRFTNTAVLRFDGKGYWQQHLLIVQAIVKSNGWSPATAAPQLFAHLDGEALKVALLMPLKERERWKDLANGMSEYYNCTGRLAVFRRRFESASRRPGVDPATFATELGILAVQRCEDMGKCTCDLMIRNKFIAAQRSCELRRYLDGASSDASIREIVYSCRVWESHSVREPSSEID